MLLVVLSTLWVTALSVCPQVFFRPLALPVDSCFKTKPSAPTLLIASQGPPTPAHGLRGPALCLVGGDSAWRQTSPPPNFLFMSPSLPPSPVFHPILTLLGDTQVEPTATREAIFRTETPPPPPWCLQVLNPTEAAQTPPLKPSPACALYRGSDSQKLVSLPIRPRP